MQEEEFYSQCWMLVHQQIMQVVHRYIKRKKDRIIIGDFGRKILLLYSHTLRVVSRLSFTETWVLRLSNKVTANK